LPSGVESSRSSVPDDLSRRVATLVMRNITTNGKTPSNGAPILSNTGVPLKIQASKPISTHGTAISMARVRWSPRT
jgi:hypothetical protein